MPPERRKRRSMVKKGDASDTSDVVTDATMEPVSAGVPGVRRTGSDSSDGEEGRRKDARGVAASTTAAAFVAPTGSSVEPVKPKRVSRPRKRVSEGSEPGVIGELKAVTTSLLEEIMVDGVDSMLAKSVLVHSGKYESLLMRLVAENERLRGRLDVYEAGGVGGGGAGPVVAYQAANKPPAVGLPRRTLVQTPVVPTAIPKPVETWSVVVKGKKGVTSKEVVEKVVTEVGPTLGVRVHELRPLRDGGAVIRTPSVAEREKVAANKKFGEVGLEVSIKDKLGPKVVVQKVQPEITPSVFMEELFAHNFEEKMTPDQFRKSVRLVTSSWNPKGGPVSVVLEGSSEAMQHLLDVGRCYIKWFSFLVRPHDAVPCCFRCLGFDHMVRECKMKDDVCRMCGEVGHIASLCAGQINCRNCTLKGLPSGHLMMSAACPVYSAIVARANARH